MEQETIIVPGDRHELQGVEGVDYQPIVLLVPPDCADALNGLAIYERGPTAALVRAALDQKGIELAGLMDEGTRWDDEDLRVAEMRSKSDKIVSLLEAVAGVRA
jgi:hypothetical protein